MRLMLAGVLAASLMLQGCLLLVLGAGAGAGVGTVAYVRGELQTTYAAPLNRTWDAALGALKDLAIPVTTIRKDELGGTIEATGATGKQSKSPRGPSIAGSANDSEQKPLTVERQAPP